MADTLTTTTGQIEVQLDARFNLNREGDERALDPPRVTVVFPDGSTDSLRVKSWQARGVRQETTARLLDVEFAQVERWRTDHRDEVGLLMSRRYTREAAAEASEASAGAMDREGEYYYRFVQALTTLDDMAGMPDDPHALAAVLTAHHDEVDGEHRERLGAQVDAVARWLLELAAALGNVGRVDERLVRHGSAVAMARET